MSMMLSVAVVAGSFLGSAASGALVQPQAAMVRVDAARLESVENWRAVTGRVRPARRSDLATQEEGQVVAVDFDEGDRVEAGDVLVMLDDQRARLEVARASAVVSSREATIAEREADLADAEKDLERVEDSASKGSATPTEVDKARIQVQRAEARLAEAQAELASATSDLDLANRRLEDMTIEAPFAGYVVRKDTELGQWLGRGDTVLELLELDSVEVWLDVPERYLAELERGSGRVRIRIDAAGLELEESITGIVPEVDALSRLVPVWVRVSNAAHAIAPGMTVAGFVPTGRVEQALTVHKDAILRDDAGEFVYFNAGGTAAPARIERLFAVGEERVAIRPGALAPGAELVVEGNERLFPGRALSVVNAGGEGGGAAPGGG